LSFISLLFIKFSKYFGFNLERDHSEYWVVGLCSVERSKVLISFILSYFFNV
jgi:hypothetical protein